MAQGARGMPFSRTGVSCGVCRCGVKAENVETRLERHNAPPSRYGAAASFKSFQFLNRGCLAPNALAVL